MRFLANADKNRVLALCLCVNFFLDLGACREKVEKNRDFFPKDGADCVKIAFYGVAWRSDVIDVFYG